MSKILIEYIDACAWCAKYKGFVETLIKNYGDLIELKVYKVGKDFSYIQKYGFISKSILIFDQKIKITNLTNSNIEKTIKEYMEKI